MTRRGRNEGTIYERADGRWTGAVDEGWRDGRRVRRQVYGKTRREVADKLTAALRSRDLGIAAPSDRLTIAAYLLDWLQAARPSIRPATYASYEAIVRVHIAPALGRVPLAKLTAAQVEALLRAKLAAGLSPRRVAMIRATLRRALGRAVKHSLLVRNVAAIADPPKQVRAEIQPLSPDEARAFLAHVRGHRLEALFVTALATGLRQGELLGLSWKDVELDARTLTVRTALQRVDGRLTLVQPKSAAGRRTVTLPAFAIAALRDHRKRQLEERLAAGPYWAANNWDLVFVSTLGSPLDGTNVLHTFQRLLADADLPRRRFHDLRHSTATALLAQGVSPRVVMEILGHSQISLTLGTYSHVLPELRRQAADRLDALMGG
jgi:integrase